MSSKAQPPEQVIGWREWVTLPRLGIPSIKAKVDTGARTSSLHAVDLEPFRKGQRAYVRFRVFPEQRSSADPLVVTAPVLTRRAVRNSGGGSEDRWVIVTPMAILGIEYPIELTLTRRDLMGFRMLLGREAIRGRFLVDAAGSFYNGRRVKGTRRIRNPKRPQP